MQLTVTTLDGHALKLQVDPAGEDCGMNAAATAGPVIGGKF